MKAILIGFLAVVALLSATAQNVGIGTNSPSPSAQLDVSSTTKGLLIPRMTSAQRIAIANPANGLMVYETTSKSFWFYNGGSWSAISGSGSNYWMENGNNIYNGNNGNIGIGTSTGIKEKLSVKGNLFVTHTNPNDLSNGGNKAVLNLHGANAGLGIVNFLKPDTSIAASITYANILSQFFLQNGNNLYQLFLRNNGNVGIGTNNPTQKLDIDGNIRIREDILADGKVIATGIVSGSALQTPGNLQVSGFGFMNGNFSTNGNLSVGGTSTLTGSISTEGDITVKNTGAIIQLKDGSNVNKGFMQLNGNDLRIGPNSTNINGKFVVRTAAGDQFFVDNAGYVGIGVATNGAEARVHVGTGVGASLTQNGYVMIGNTSSSNLVFDNNEIQARDGGNAAPMYLQRSGGTVRIGAVPVPAGFKFAVDGKIICEELNVKLSSNWPDYVFGNKYILRPLSEVEQFIHLNKHLPNVPSAVEVEKNGINIGDMQKIMMEKIEELTLYIIALQKQMDELKKDSK